MESLLEDDDAEPIKEILFDCNNIHARNSINRLFCYLVCRLKEIEADKIIENKFDVTTESYYNSVGERCSRQVKEPQSLILRFFNQIMREIPTRGARNWKQIESTMDLIFAFGVQSSEDVETEQRLG